MLFLEDRKRIGKSRSLGRWGWSNLGNAEPLKKRDGGEEVVVGLQPVVSPKKKKRRRRKTPTRVGCRVMIVSDWTDP